ncbi:acyl-CoA dehydrogenase family protein [Nitrospirillum sp. BR 11164]|uniref:acyl-CoA dehydrogenase family protein n=1 Tax=Nitrospirillum sp. BR 11164 TaxID=3104324 RepID=UPI002AFECF5C|nr:acyl-CoA dehydrogenase family protein [Nitrospirillum sp. BR 11164]MEA1652878.1 acyl-CoA dehydrogenase family protein [Nitrospirillum sp. BR 11164]
MRDWNALSDEAFRQAARDFIKAHCPPELRRGEEHVRWAQARGWYQAMAEHGWLAPGWPAEHGGMALKPAKHLIYLEEWARAGISRVMEQGVLNVGPVLLAHGTPEQVSHYLPRILSGEDLWCQGFSEPGAGSDLAGLRTEAHLEGDTFILNGHKIWTSGAVDANHIFVLTRTDKTVKKQAGISFILVDMNQPGVTVKPIVTVNGDAEFAEVFLDDVRAPAANLVGGLNNGWRVAQSLLGFERVWAGSPHMGRQAMDRLVRVARLAGRDRDPAIIDRIAQLQLDLADNSEMYERLAQEIRAGHSFGFEVSTLKIVATETYARITELTLEIAGEQGGLSGAAPFADGPVFRGEADLLRDYLTARAPMIYGGTVQIHRNILAKRVLGLPA